MRNDNVYGIMIKDETVVKYGNMMILKYSTSTHHYKMIAQQLRHICRLVIEIKKLNTSVQHVKDMLDPKNYDDLVKAIHNLAGLADGKYKSPSVANHSCTLIMHLVQFVKCQSIKNGDQDLRKRLEDFSYLMQHSQNALITKIAGENRTQHQRSKVELLPTTKEINKLNDLLSSEIEDCVRDLQIDFDFNTWLKLSELTLIALMVFNRKRPGDIEKTHIVEYKSLTTIDAATKDKLNEEEKECASNFGRFISRGKLNRPAPTLVSKQNMVALDIILKHRDQAGIEKENKYLFANPKGTKLNYIK